MTAKRFYTTMKRTESGPCSPIDLIIDRDLERWLSAQRRKKLNNKLKLHNSKGVNRHEQ